MATTDDVKRSILLSKERATLVRPLPIYLVMSREGLLSSDLSEVTDAGRSWLAETGCLFSWEGVGCLDAGEHTCTRAKDHHGKHRCAVCGRETNLAKREPPPPPEPKVRPQIPLTAAALGVLEALGAGMRRTAVHPAGSDEVSSNATRHLVKLGLVEPVPPDEQPWVPGQLVRNRRWYRITEAGRARLEC